MKKRGNTVINACLKCALMDVGDRECKAPPEDCLREKQPTDKETLRVFYRRLLDVANNERIDLVDTVNKEPYYSSIYQQVAEDRYIKSLGKQFIMQEVKKIFSIDYENELISRYWI